ncbi:MAG: Enhancer of polycomb-like protein 1 [Trizodia sp. TS-e1964]|nr:MAG: Enhancer of polycomb-like protein 1 [Trizodia sp. TS-e1964]
MTRAAAVAARFRQRKLSTKQTLQILREHQVEKVEDDPQRNIPKVDTGVEKGEEIEHHLQAAISASQAAAVGGKVAQIYIPTPDTIQSTIHYDRLYPKQFSQPATYIRFSSTVEDCGGCSYCMTSEDDSFLLSMNQTITATPKCSETQFEEVMDFFEQTAQSRQPFAVVDSPPVLSLEEIESAYDERLDMYARAFAPKIYPHWKLQRSKRGNRPLMPTLKFETGQDTDDADPYVCFRRREVRQVRKTRGRDAQSTEKLRKLRREMEDSSLLVGMVRRRQAFQREINLLECQALDQRAAVKEMKRKLNITDNDEDLVNQKPLKKKAPEAISAQRPQPSPLRLPTRLDGRSSEPDLISLQDKINEVENENQRVIDHKVSQHTKWNQNFVDLTRAPLAQINDQSVYSNFRIALAEFLPTTPPPAGDDGIDGVQIRYASPTNEPPYNKPAFRRRIGRGGRMMIDRRMVNLRGIQPQPREGIHELVLDRFKYDRDDDDEDWTPLPVDPYDAFNMKYRSAMYIRRDQHGIATMQLAQANAERPPDTVMANGSSTAGPSSSPHQSLNSQIPPAVAQQN